MRVLIGYDGSPCADDAIADLQRAGLAPQGIEALVLAVADVYGVQAGDPPSDESAAATAVVRMEIDRLRRRVGLALDRARADADAAAARVRGLFPAWSVRAEAVADTPHWALVKKSAEWSADLVVVGSRGRSALGRLFLGSVSQQVLHNAPCSVRVGRCAADRARPREPRVRLVLGVDGSVDSAAAVSAVAARHWPPGSEVLVVGVLDARAILNQLELAPPPGASPIDAGMASGGLRDLLARVCDDLRRSGIAAAATVLDGDPKKVLIQEAQRSAADCIVVGAKGHSRVERLLLGSVSAAVAARADCSVEVVRTGSP
jgi:nucleotide-binding universal stress UspA family protein